MSIGLFSKRKEIKMTLQHNNRIRQNSGKHVVRELQDVEALEPANETPSEADIRARAYEIFLNRNSAPGNADVDWLQAECELRASMLSAPRIKDAD
jgi:hypothetical protein